MNVSLTAKQQEYIARQIASGDYQNASELVRDALRMHQHYREKLLAELKADIEKAWDGPNSEKTIDEIVDQIIATDGQL